MWCSRLDRQPDVNCLAFTNKLLFERLFNTVIAFADSRSHRKTLSDAGTEKTWSGKSKLQPTSWEPPSAWGSFDFARLKPPLCGLQQSLHLSWDGFKTIAAMRFASILFPLCLPTSCLEKKGTILHLVYLIALKKYKLLICLWKDIFFPLCSLCAGQIWNTLELLHLNTSEK